MSFLVVIERSLAELDWILPVCRYLKINEKSAEIHLLFMAYVKDDILGTNRFYREMLADIVDEYYDLSDCLPSPIASIIRSGIKLKYLYRKRIKSRNNFSKQQLVTEEKKNVAIHKNVGFVSAIINKVRLLLFSYRLLKKDISRFLQWTRQEVACFAINRMVMNNDVDVILKQYRHKELIHFDDFVEKLRKNGIKTIGFPQSSRLHLSAIPRDEDLLLFNTDQEMRQAKGCSQIKGKLVAVGVPRYDRDWIAYLLARFEKEPDMEFFQEKRGKIFLVNLQKEYSWIFSWKGFKEYLYDILDVLFPYADATIIFKPHPSQNLTYLNYCASLHPVHDHVMISNSSSLALAAKSDLIITMPSTSIYDLMPAGKPVLEYFDYRNFKEFQKSCATKADRSDFETKLMDWPIYSEKSGAPASIYQDMGFVDGAADPAKLKGWVARHLNTTTEWPGQLKWRERFPADAAKRAVKNIVELNC